MTGMARGMGPTLSRRQEKLRSVVYGAAAIFVGTSSCFFKGLGLLMDSSF